MSDVNELNNLHLLRPELMFRESFKVSGPLKESVKRCLIAALVGLIIGGILGSFFRALFL